MTRVGFLLIEDRRPRQWPGKDRRACLPMACTLPLRAKTLYARGSFALTSQRCWHVGRQGGSRVHPSLMCINLRLNHKPKTYFVGVGGTQLPMVAYHVKAGGVLPKCLRMSQKSKRSRR